MFKLTKAGNPYRDSNGQFSSAEESVTTGGLRNRIKEIDFQVRSLSESADPKAARRADDLTREREVLQEKLKQREPKRNFLFRKANPYRNADGSFGSADSHDFVVDEGGFSVPNDDYDAAFRASREPSPQSSDYAEHLAAVKEREYAATMNAMKPSERNTRGMLERLGGRRFDDAAFRVKAGFGYSIVSVEGGKAKKEEIAYSLRETGFQEHKGKTATQAVFTRGDEVVSVTSKPYNSIMLEHIVPVKKQEFVLTKAGNPYRNADGSFGSADSHDFVVGENGFVVEPERIGTGVRVPRDPGAESHDGPRPAPHSPGGSKETPFNSEIGELRRKARTGDADAIKELKRLGKQDFDFVFTKGDLSGGQIAATGGRLAVDQSPLKDMKKKKKKKVDEYLPDGADPTVGQSKQLRKTELDQWADDLVAEAPVQVGLKKFDEEMQVVWAEVYVPNVPDSQSDYMTEDEVRKMAWRFIASGAMKAIDEQHDNKKSGAIVVESFIARKDDPTFIPDSWVVGVHIPDKALWERVKSGELNGFSLQGAAMRSKAEVELEIPEVLVGKVDSGQTDHSHDFQVQFADDGRFLGGRTGPASTDLHTHAIVRGTITEVANGHSHRYSFTETIREAMLTPKTGVVDRGPTQVETQE